MKNLFYMTAAVILTILTGCNKETPQPEITKQTGVLTTIDTSTYQLTAYLRDFITTGENISIIIDSVDYMSLPEIKSLKDSEVKSKKLAQAKETGFYLSNNETSLKELKADKNTLYIMQTFSITKDGSMNYNEKINGLQFEHLVRTISKTRFNNIPFRITHKENTIIKIEEIYIP